MSIASDTIDRYLLAEGSRDAMVRDAAYRLQFEVIRDVLSRAEEAMSAERVDPGTVVRVIRRLLYGTPLPDAEEAEERIRLQDEAIRQAMLAPPDPVVVADMLGLPPEPAGAHAVFTIADPAGLAAYNAAVRDGLREQFGLPPL